MSLTLGIWARLSRTGKLPHIQRRQAGKRSTPLEEHVVFADSDRPRKNPRCHEEDLGGERAVYEPESHDVAVLNGTASVILDLCDGERSVADVLSCLCERYPVEESVLRKDLLETLDHLRSRSLIS
jgi:hypothetical protein